MELLIFALLYFLPAGVANMSPVFAARLPVICKWKTPIDFGKSWRNRRVLGDNKTWRGIFFGTLMGGLTALAVNGIVATNSGSVLVVFGTGCAMGFGALFGDAFESFLKRQKGIDPGRSWFPFDQTDYIIGGLLFVYPIAPMPLWLMASVLILYFCLHVITSYIGWLVGLKATPI